MHRPDLPGSYEFRGLAVARLCRMHLPDLGLRLQALHTYGRTKAAAPGLAQAGRRVYLSLRRSLRCQDGPRVGDAPRLHVTVAAGTASREAAAVPAGLRWPGHGAALRSPSGLCAREAGKAAAGN